MTIGGLWATAGALFLLLALLILLPLATIRLDMPLLVTAVACEVFVVLCTFALARGLDGGLGSHV